MAIQTEELTADFTGIINEADYQEYIRYEGTDQATILPVLVESAIRQAEAFCSRSFGNKTFKYLNDRICYSIKYYLPFAPIRDVTSVNSVAKDGTETLLVENTDYYIGGLGRKYIVFNSANYGVSYSVEYSAGLLDPSTIHPNAKEGILKILSEDFENRMDGLSGESISKMSRNSSVLLAPFKNKYF